MNADSPPVAPDVQGLLAAEVERQVAALRQEMDAKIAEVRARTVDDAATIVVFSGDLDKAIAAFIMATGAAAAGLQTSMFFTFWGLSVLKKKGAAGGPKNVMERMFAMMTPSSGVPVVDRQTKRRRCAGASCATTPRSAPAGSSPAASRGSTALRRPGPVSTSS